MKEQRAITQTFERFNREKLIFVQTVAELCRHEANARSLADVDGPILLHSLLSDASCRIRCSAALAVGRITQNSQQIAEYFVSCGSVPVLLTQLASTLTSSVPDATNQARRERLALRRACLLALRGIGRHTSALASTIIENDGISVAIDCSKTLESDGKEGALWLLEALISQSPEAGRRLLAQQGVTVLLECLSSSESSIGRGSAAVIASLCRQDALAAEAVVDNGGLETFSSILSGTGSTAPDTVSSPSSEASRMARQIILSLCSIAKTRADLADEVLSKGIVARIVEISAQSPRDHLLQRHACAALRDIARHGVKQAIGVLDTTNALHQLILCIGTLKGNDLLPGVMAIGFLAAHKDLAGQVVVGGAILPLVHILQAETLDHVRSAAVWAFGQLGRHTRALASTIASTGVLTLIAALETSPTSSEDLSSKCNKALTGIIKHLDDLRRLESLLQCTLTKVSAEQCLSKISELLRVHPHTKAGFVQSGGLRTVQMIAEAAPSGVFSQAILAITDQFPQEVVNYFSPAYNAALLEKLSAPLRDVSIQETEITHPEHEPTVQKQATEAKAAEEVCLCEEEEKIEDQVDIEDGREELMSPQCESFGYISTEHSRGFEEEEEAIVDIVEGLLNSVTKDY